MNQPLYQVIRGAIEAQIMSGALKPGDRIPFEHELMTEHGCSRMTVNKALSSLAAAGLISRQRRKGSFVSSPRIHMAALQIPDMREEIEGRGHVYRFDLLGRRIEGEQLMLQCLHVADAMPFAIEERWINLAAVPDALEVDFAATPPGTWLLTHVPWTEAEHRITASAAGAQAKLLDVAADHACLVLERWTWREGESITHVRQIFNGGRFDLTARFLSQAESSSTRHPGSNPG